MASTKFEGGIDDFIANQLESIDEQIAKIDSSRVVKAAESLLAKKTTLMAARRALLGGNNMTGGSSGTRIHQSDVVRALKPHSEQGNGLAPADLAEELHTTEAVIRGHLNRGKDERFLKDANNLWYLRDPERGVNTIEDLEVEEG